MNCETNDGFSRSFKDHVMQFSPSDVVGRAADTVRRKPSPWFNRFLAVGSLIVTTAAISPASAATVVAVQATDDLYAAGRPTGPCCGGDSVPANSPILVPLTFVSGEYLTFTATGGASHAPGQPASPTAEGDTSFKYNLTPDYGTGIAGQAQVYLNALAGVFLGPTNPTGAAPAEFTGSVGGASFAPGLNQIFFIGDGLTGIGSGAQQTFYVPAGATRLYLGITDDGGYYDNFGTIVASITANVPGVATAVPEPESLAFGLGGLRALGPVRPRPRPNPHPP